MDGRYAQRAIAAFALLALGAYAPAQADDGSSGAGAGRRIPLGAYGEAHLFREDSETESVLSRFVVFLGYSYSDREQLYAEIEVEDGHEVEMEQAYVDLSYWENLGIRAGLVLVPMGIINLYHEPPTFNGVERPPMDRVIIPTTWRELGAGIFGGTVDGVQYQLYVVNGLNAALFTGETGIRGGRGKGQEVHSEDLSVTGRVSTRRFAGANLGASFYAGGAGQDTDALSDVKVGIAEVDARYAAGGLGLRGQYARVWISDAENVTNFLRDADPVATAVGSGEEGFYLEAGYDVLHGRGGDRSLVPFIRYDSVNLRAETADVVNPGDSEAQTFFTAGLTVRPRPEIAFKYDLRRALDHGEETRHSAGLGFMF